MKAFASDNLMTKLLKKVM